MKNIKWLGWTMNPRRTFVYYVNNLAKDEYTSKEIIEVNVRCIDYYYNSKKMRSSGINVGTTILDNNTDTYSKNVNVE